MTETERQALRDLRQYKFVLCGVTGVRNILVGQNSTFAYRDLIDNFIIPVKLCKTRSEMLPYDPSFQRVPWDACVRRGKMSPDT